MVTRATIHYLQAIGGGLTGMFFNVTLFKIRRVFNVDFFQAGFLSSTAFCDDEEEVEPQLIYEQLSADLKAILKKDVASFLAIHSRLVGSYASLSLNVQGGFFLLVPP